MATRLSCGLGDLDRLVCGLLNEKCLSESTQTVLGVCERPPLLP